MITSTNKDVSDKPCTDGESMQSSKGLVYVYNATNGSSHHGRYYAKTGMSANSNITNNRLHGKALTFLVTR